jgi:signal transduction histidine kinase
LDYYTEKLSLIGTDFSVGEYSDCILSGDPNRLTEVLQNIIENAVKYGDGRSISITFSSEEDCKLIAVRNSGCTLSENELPHIFDSFWRGSNIGSHAGSGLGLYICRQIMHKSGGEIFAEIMGGDMIVTVVIREAG